MERLEKLENLIDVSKLNSLINRNVIVEEPKKSCKKKVCCIIAIIVAIAGLAVLAYGLYKYLKPDYLSEFDDDDEFDDLDEDFFEDDED